VIIRFTVPAVPVAQPRPQAVAFGGRARMHEKTSIKQADGTRKAHPIVAFRATVAQAATAAYSGPPHDGPASIHVTLVFPRPASMRWKTRPQPRAPHCGKPDADNVFKALTDAINGLIVVDDSRIHAATIRKFIAAGDEQPHCEVVIRFEDSPTSKGKAKCSQQQAESTT